MELKQNKYTITIKNGGEKVFAVANQHQIYGLLVGQVSLFRKTFPTMMYFRRWWTREQKQNGFPMSVIISDKEQSVTVKISFTTFVS